MFAAFNMISTDISTMMKFLLITTPSTPVIKSTALSATYALRGTINPNDYLKLSAERLNISGISPLSIQHSPVMFVRDRLWRFCQHDRSDDGTQQKHSDDFELDRKS